jgi:hypothetical protein
MKYLMAGAGRSTADNGFHTESGDGVGPDDILCAGSSDGDGPLGALLTRLPPLLDG